MGYEWDMQRGHATNLQIGNTYHQFAHILRCFTPVDAQPRRNSRVSRAFRTQESTLAGVAWRSELENRGTMKRWSNQPVGYITDEHGVLMSIVYGGFLI